MMKATLPLLGAVLLLAGCGTPEPIEAVGEVPRNVRVLQLAPTEINEFYEVAGPVSPVRAADLAAQESGPVTVLGAAKGARVEPGAVIVEQERDILKAELAAAEAALATQEYNVDKVRQLHAAGKVSRIELLNAETQFTQARSSAEVARVRWERAAVSAPFAGIVVDRYVELGEMLAPGVRVARVIDPYTLKLTAFLTDVQVRWVHAGDAAEVLLGAAAEAVPARVAFVSPEADLQTGKFAVEIEIPNPDLAWQSGVIGRARLPKHRTEGAIAVPRDAVLPDRTGDSVFVVEGDRARRRSVRLGAYQGLMVVVQDGLAAGERIVVRGQRDLRDGSLVSVTEVATAADGTLAGDPAAAAAQGSATRIGGSGSAAEAAR
jgi:membrane fusion protein (multidrug efflux system)